MTNPTDEKAVPPASPLAEADPHSLDELLGARFAAVVNKQPLELTDEDLRTAVAYYRADRVKIAKEQNSKPKAKPKPKSVAEALAQAKAITDAL